MSFAPTFGAFGDFISLSILIKDIVNAIGDAHGSVADYRSLANELDNISTVLEQAHRLCCSYSAIPEVQVLHLIAQKTIEDFRADLVSFKTRLSKYKSSLGGKSGGLPKRTFFKVVWLKEKDNVNQFRSKLLTSITLLNVIIGTANTRITSANEEARRNDVTTSSETSRLILETSQLILGSIQTLSNDSRTKIDRNIQLNMLAYCDLQARLQSLESNIAKLPAEQFFTFENAFGRPMQVSLTLVSSWEMFDTIMIEHYKKQRGFNRVTRKRYVLQDHRRHREIRQNIPWQSAMLPGCQVSMSIICSSQSQPESGYHTRPSCPRCFSVSAAETTGETRCNACDLVYTRVTEIKDTDMGLPPHGGKAQCPTCRQPEEVEESDDEDISAFTRVQLVTKQRRLKDYQSRRLDDKNERKEHEVLLSIAQSIMDRDRERRRRLN